MAHFSPFPRETESESVKVKVKVKLTLHQHLNKGHPLGWEGVVRSCFLEKYEHQAYCSLEAVTCFVCFDFGLEMFLIVGMFMCVLVIEPDIDVVMAKYMITHIGDRFCELVEQEKEAMSWVSPDSKSSTLAL